jgi:hypothetical protein
VSGNGDVARHDVVHPGRTARAHAAADLADDVGLRQNADHIAAIANDDKIGMGFGHKGSGFHHRCVRSDQSETLTRPRQHLFDKHLTDPRV